MEAKLLHVQSTASIACAINRLADAVTNISQSINRLVDEKISSKSAPEIKKKPLTCTYAKYLGVWLGN